MVTEELDNFSVTNLCFTEEGNVEQFSHAVRAKFVLDLQPLTCMREFFLPVKSGEIKPVEIHDFVPCRYEVLYKGPLGV